MTDTSPDLDQARRDAAARHGLPTQLAARLLGSTAEELDADAASLSGTFGTPNPLPGLAANARRRRTLAGRGTDPVRSWLAARTEPAGDDTTPPAPKPKGSPDLRQGPRGAAGPKAPSDPLRAMAASARSDPQGRVSFDNRKGRSRR